MNLQHLKGQMQDIFNQLDTEKQKLDHFIEETRNHFQNEKLIDSNSNQSSNIDSSKNL